MVDHRTQRSFVKTPARLRSAVDRIEVVIIILLAFLPLLFFWRLITPNPTDRMRIASGDFTEQYFPLRAFAAQEWVQGRTPLWNPYLYGGQPALADIQSGALYPPHIIQALVLGWGGPLLLGQEIGFPLWALEWQVIAHFSLAAVGTYLFARHLGLRSGVSLRRARFGGVVASLVFSYGGYLTGFPVQQMTILEVSAWLPWILWGLSKAASPQGRYGESANLQTHRAGMAKRESANQHAARSSTQHATRNTRSSTLSLRVTAWAALAFAMAILAGHPQTVLYIFYLSLAYVAFLAFSAWRSESTNLQMANERTQGAGVAKESSTPHLPISPSPHFFALRLLISHFLLWLVVILLGAGIAAAQLLPTLEFISHSLRADLSYQAVSAGLPLNELISIVYPGFFGGSPEYVGIATLVLVALALVLAQPRRAVFFWVGAGLVGLLLAFGGNLFVYPFFYLFAPGFEAVRQQERAFLIYSFSAAILASYGAMTLAGPLSKISRLTYARFERRLRIVAVVALGVTSFFIYGTAAATARGDEVNLFFGVLWHHLFGLIILGGMLVLLTLRSRRWLRRPWGMALVTLWLAFNLFTVNWRFNLEQPTSPALFTPDGVTQFLQAKLPTSPPPYLPISPGRIVSGGLLPGGHNAASVYNLEDLTGNTPLQLARVAAFLEHMPAWRLWQLMNVRYVVDQRDIADAGLQLVFEEDELKVFEMGDPFDRAWFVSAVEVITEDEPALARLAADDFDLRQTAIVADPLGTSLAEASASTATVIDFSPTHLSLEVDAAGQHLLVISQIHYPGWRAEIDGQPVELRRVNVVQQGVVVPAGKHLVWLTFWPRSLGVGLIISAVVFLFCGGILVLRK